MIDWVFILTPLTMLPSCSYSGFVGFGLNAVGELGEFRCLSGIRRDIAITSSLIRLLLPAAWFSTTT